MDFGSLLYKAQKNEQNSKQKSTWYKTSFEPPKKEHKEKKLSANIQKFLAKKEEEEKQKRLEAERKKKELLALRNQDKKSFKRVKSMLTKTKSANKSVLEDAVDNVNTAVTANGPLQPDEDDYGYVSKDASDLYNKLINKYSSMPAEESIFSKSSGKSSKDILSTKDRVKAALQREEEEKLLPRKRKRKSKNGEVEDDDDKSDDEKNDVKKDEKNDKSTKPDKFKIPKKNAQPPPIDFQSLLKLAEKKQHEPIMIEKKVEEKPERPMTEKEKMEYMREKERRMRREAGLSENSAEIMKKKINKPSSEKTNPSKTMEKPKNISNSSKCEPNKKVQVDKCQNSKPSSSSTPKKAKEEKKSESSKDLKNTSPEKPLIGVLSERQKMLLALKRGAPIDKRNIDLEMKKNEPNNNEPRKSLNEDSKQSKDITKNKIPNLNNQNAKNKEMKTSDSNPNIKMSSMKSVPKVIESRRAISPPRSRQFPPPDLLRKKPPKPIMKRKVIESDDEYDSEMDDFIDDSEQVDVSKYISEIFRYDRNKYANRHYEEDSDECMESNFSELQKEEFISTKYGIMEDLEDVRRTKLEKIRKKKRMLSR